MSLSNVMLPMIVIGRIGTDAARTRRDCCFRGLRYARSKPMRIRFSALSGGEQQRCDDYAAQPGLVP